MPGFSGPGMSLVLVAAISSSMALVTVTVRFACRYHYASKFGMDDWVMAGSMVTRSKAPSVYHGVGKHASTLSNFDLHQALMTFYISQIFYKLAINSTKISVIFLYRRIFTNILSFRRLTSGFMLFILLFAFTSILATVFQCTPINRAIDHQIKGSCIDLMAFWHTNAIGNIATDLVILALPQRLIYQLQMPRRLKHPVFDALVQHPSPHRHHLRLSAYVEETAFGTLQAVFRPVGVWWR
ncbi:MAG: hypothetical protein LQ337_004850 [Flavoplaca oasis]|nr:MAG: hypothetical protein LQ337_004850 [Flavoplaca oasis]